MDNKKLAVVNISSFGNAALVTVRLDCQEDNPN